MKWRYLDKLFSFSSLNQCFWWLNAHTSKILLVWKSKEHDLLRAALGLCSRSSGSIRIPQGSCMLLDCYSILLISMSDKGFNLIDFWSTIFSFSRTSIGIFGKCVSIMFEFLQRGQLYCSIIHFFKQLWWKKWESFCPQLNSTTFHS